MLININHWRPKLACCTLVNTGAWASTVPVAGPGSAHLGGRAWAHFTPPFSSKYGGIDLGRHHHNLVRAHNLIYPSTCHGLL